jgi:pimeloyl-ACP methyl ester carboxylesterase
MSQIRPEIKKLELEDAELQYLHYPSDGPPLVLLHATGLLPWLWHPIARNLSSRYRIIAPYFCDHRTCEPEEGGLSWEILAKDLVSLCEGLSLRRPYLVGHSMGGTVVTIAHASEGLQAEKIVLIEPIFLPRSIYESGLTVDTHPLASRSIKRRNKWDTEDEARNYLRSRKMFEKWDDEMLDLYIRYGMVSGDGGGLVLACHPRREAAMFMGGMQFNPWPVIPLMRCPVLVVEGEASENRSFIDLPAIASAIPRGGYRLVPGAGHLIPQERPSETAQIIADFLGS